jgi:hypothetical protein
MYVLLLQTPALKSESKTFVLCLLFSSPAITCSTEQRQDSGFYWETPEGLTRIDWYMNFINIESTSRIWATRLALEPHYSYDVGTTPLDGYEFVLSVLYRKKVCSEEVPVDERYINNPSSRSNLFLTAFNSSSPQSILQQLSSVNIPAALLSQYSSYTSDNAFLRPHRSPGHRRLSPSH